MVSLILRFSNQPCDIVISQLIVMLLKFLVICILHLIWCLRILWRLLRILETSNKSVRSNVFSYVKVYIFWKCIQYTIHWGKTQILKKLPLDKRNGTKMVSFFFHELQLTTVLLLVCNSYMSWSQFSKTVC